MERGLRFLPLYSQSGFCGKMNLCTPEKVERGSDETPPAAPAEEALLGGGVERDGCCWLPLPVERRRTPLKSALLPCEQRSRVEGAAAKGVEERPGQPKP